MPAHPTFTLAQSYSIRWYNVVFLVDISTTEVIKVRHTILDISATFPTYEFIGYLNEENTSELNWYLVKPAYRMNRVHFNTEGFRYSCLVGGISI